MLRECGALTPAARAGPPVGRAAAREYHPEIDTGVHVMMVVDTAARRDQELPVRFAALLHDLGKGTTPKDEWPRHIAHEHAASSWSKRFARLKVPADCRDLACSPPAITATSIAPRELRPDTIVRLFEKTDALRRPQRFEQLLQACAADFNGRLGWEEGHTAPDRLRRALAAVQAVPAGEIAKGLQRSGTDSGRIHAARSRQSKQPTDREKSSEIGIVVVKGKNGRGRASKPDASPAAVVPVILPAGGVSAARG